MITAGTATMQKTLREWRAYLRLTKADVAHGLGVHPSTYARMEAHPEDVTVGEANVLAKIFGCEVSGINFFE